MVRLLFRIILCGAMCGLVSEQGHATPQTIRVNGSIFDSTGAPVTGSRDIQIKAYDAATAGTLLWTSSVYNASVSSGSFAIDLDASDTTVSSPSLTNQILNSAAGTGVWFEVHVDTGTAGNGTMNSDETVTPRIRGSGATFALAAAYADAISGVTATALEYNYLAGVTANIQGQIAGKATSSAIAWQTVSGVTALGEVNKGYFVTGTSGVTVTLPTTCAVGDGFRIGGSNPYWILAQNAGQKIYYYPSEVTTTGTAGALRALEGDVSVELVCRVANTDWQVVSSNGRWSDQDGISYSQAFTSVGSVTIPSRVSQVTVKAWGAGGGGGGGGSGTPGGAGGGGAYMTVLMGVTAGQVLGVTVGTGGGSAPGNNNDSGGGGGGGGYSAVGTSGTLVLLAAGGGGGGGGCRATYCSPSASGGAGGPGGVTTGVVGVTVSYSSYWAAGGGGGTQASGGAAGTSSNGATYYGTAGSSFTGGTGGGNTTTKAAGGTSVGGAGASNYQLTGGGGGGGYYGGGGGAAVSGNTYSGSGGGGGSSYGSSGSAGSGATPGNSSDSDYLTYTSTAGTGGAGGVLNSTSTAGSDGLVIIKWVLQ